jgi:tRNA threonylcarbamoyladenosine biosynthesis protein TsaE
MFQLDISDINQLPEAAKKLLNYCGNEKVLLFDAEMGSGKTTFIKSLCKELNSYDVITSPTYSIVNEYQTKNGYSIFHFDLYRLKSTQELFEMGFEDYLTSNNYILIEWPELAMPFLDEYVKINILQTNNIRYLRAEKHHS